MKNSLDPDLTYLYLENKGKNEAQLRREIARIVQKWRALPVAPKETTVTNVLAEKQAESRDVEFVDNGIGIKDVCLSKYFEKFVSPSDYLVDFRHWFEEAIAAEKIHKTRQK